MELLAISSVANWAIIAGVLLVLVVISMILRATGFTRRWDQKRGLTNSQGAPTPKAIHLTILLVIVGIVVQLMSGSWFGVALIAVGGIVGLGRYAAYRKTGVYR